MSIVKLFRRSEEAPAAGWYVRESADGLLVTRSPDGARKLEPVALLDGWLSQLEDEGFALHVSDDFALSWDTLYDLRNHREHGVALQMLALPKTVDAAPVLSSRGSLEDESFGIALDGWKVRGALVSESPRFP